jgi:hypothetical protein
MTPEMLELVHGNIVKRANACLNASGHAATMTPEMLELVHGNIVKRANACLNANGQNFEHLFKKNLLLLKCLIVVLPLKLIRMIANVFNNTMILRISR